MDSILLFENPSSHPLSLLLFLAIFLLSIILPFLLPKKLLREQRQSPSLLPFAPLVGINYVTPLTLMTMP